MFGIARRLGPTLLLMATPAALAAAQSKSAPVLHPPQPPIHTQWAGAAPAPRSERGRSHDEDRGREYRRDRDGDRYYHDGDRYYQDSEDGRARHDRVPVLVTNDGRVFADFGNGYEQVVRSCATPYGQMTAHGSQTYSVPTYGTPQYALPDYANQQSVPSTAAAPSPQNESQAQQGSVAGVPSACWTTDRQGAVMVLRP